jgi:enoyl-CoA hydratase/carnithine racemase
VAFVEINKMGPYAMVRLNRGKVNAINEAVVDELSGKLKELQFDDSIRAIVLTGTGHFFSFGFDVPELYGYPKEDFKKFLMKFTGLYKYMFLYPKPIIAAINGHATAGGCMLTNACDYRIMVSGKPRISLNEITFASAVFLSSVEILKYRVGAHYAQEVLLEGRMYSAEEARNIGLIDEVVIQENLNAETEKTATRFSVLYSPAFRQIKQMLRHPVMEACEPGEAQGIEKFIDIWYSPEVREILKAIIIR